MKPIPVAVTGATGRLGGRVARRLADAQVNATQQAAKSALERAGLTHEVRTFPGVDHAFFNDTGPRYGPAAATDAYQAVLGWLGRHAATA